MRMAGTVLAMVIFGSAASVGAISFTPLPDIRTFGGNTSLVFGVSDDGTKVFGRIATDLDPTVWVAKWTVDEGWDPLFVRGNPLAVSGDGEFVSGGGSPGAYLWSLPEGVVTIHDDTFGIDFDEAFGLSADGSVAVGHGDDLLNGVHVAIRWRDGVGAESLGDLTGGAFHSRASDVSADGSVVVGSGTSADGNEAFRWVEGQGMEGLGDLPGNLFFSAATAVSGDGSTVVGSSSGVGGNQPFRWTEAEGIVGLGSASGVALGVSNDGSVIVGYSGTRSFVWDADHGLRFLDDILIASGIDLTDWDLDLAVDVSADGLTVVGNGQNPFGFPEAWMVDLTPPPGDGNGDLFVDGLDYLIWADHYGDDPPGSPANGDYNDDGVVDGLDYLVWASNFGPAPSDATAVPEPGTLATLLTGVFACGMHRRRRMTPHYLR